MMTGSEDCFSAGAATQILEGDAPAVQVQVRLRQGALTCGKMEDLSPKFEIRDHQIYHLTYSIKLQFVPLYMQMTTYLA